MTERIGSMFLWSAGLLLLAFLGAPVLGLATGISLSDLRAGLAHPLVWPAVRLSVWTSSVTLVTVVAFGTPLAWLCARRHGRIEQLVETLIQLPIVMPPAVAGIALLLTFGRQGALSGVLYSEAHSLAFSTAAVIVAQVFVSAPFYVRAAIGAFRRIDPELMLVARSLGASQLRILWHVAVPLSASSLAAGAASSWARALGEFGATLLFAGNLTGRTQTLPLAVYTAFESDLRLARTLSLILLGASLLILLVMHLSTSFAKSRDTEVD